MCHIGVPHGHRTSPIRVSQMTCWNMKKRLPSSGMNCCRDDIKLGLLGSPQGRSTWSREEPKPGEGVFSQQHISPSLAVPEASLVLDLSGT